MALAGSAFGCAPGLDAPQPLAPEAPPPEPFLAPLPAGFPVPVVPADNPLSEAKVELGRWLFFDRRLSADGSYACASCHQPRRAFTDGRPRAVGVTGELHPRGTMTLTNVAYNLTLTWADPTLRRLEDQMLVPMFSRQPVELGLADREEELLARLRREPRYRRAFAESFPAPEEPITVGNVVRAIASFERILISGSSPYDRFVYWGENEAFTEPARRGMRLFFSARLGCAECHAGFNFSGPVVYRERPVTEPEFHDTGVHELDGVGDSPAGSRGVFEHTGRSEDRGRFRAPTLRNIAITAPYMHDGSLSTLEEVIAHYAAGGRQGREEPPGGGGSVSPPPETSDLRGFEITDSEAADLVAFLEALTDRTFLEDPRFRDPWPAP